MKMIGFVLSITLGSLAFAASIYALLALPGLTDDASSTVPLASIREAGR